MRNVVSTRAWLALPVAILIAALLGGALGPTPVAVASTLNQANTTVTVSPAQVNLECGKTATVDILINNVQNLFGVDIKVSFDPNVLEVVDANATALGVQIQPGNFLDVSGGQGLIQVNGVDVNTGTISYAAIRLNPAPAQSGSGIIATVTFRGKAAGTSPVELKSVMLSDPTAQPIPANLANGSVAVTCTGQPTATTPPGPTATPVPGQPTAVPGKQCVHIVQPGDTLYSIARLYGSTVYAIQQANNLADPNVIYVGQKLVIPGCTPWPPPPPPPGQCFTYIVKPGDTLYGIALKYGDTVSGLSMRNGIVNPNLIYVGQPLSVCPAGAPGPQPCSAVHVVQPGETLYRIALRYGTTVYTLAAANNLATPNLIYAGQTLCIP